MMDDIWGLSDGSSASDTGTEYEMPSGGNFEPIPDGSKVLAMVEDANWVTDERGNERLDLKWTVVKPEEYANRKINQKCWIFDMDPSVSDPEKARKKRDRARTLFAATDANAGGKLARKGGKPTSEDVVIALANKLMVIGLRVWEQDDRNDPTQKVRGNWVYRVEPKTGEIFIAPEKPSRQTTQRPAQSSGGGGYSALDDEIPFAPEWRI